VVKKGFLCNLKKNNRFISKKLDKPARKNPRPPKLTARAQKILLNRLEPGKYDLITEFVSIEFMDNYFYSTYLKIIGLKFNFAITQ
jgi:hypothetical protein